MALSLVKKNVCLLHCLLGGFAFRQYLVFVHLPLQVPPCDLRHPRPLLVQDPQVPDVLQLPLVLSLQVVR